MSEISGGSDSMDMSSETETGGTETGVSVETGGHMDLGAIFSVVSPVALLVGITVLFNSTDENCKYPTPGHPAWPGVPSSGSRVRNGFLSARGIRGSACLSAPLS